MVARFLLWSFIKTHRVLTPPPHYTENVLALGVGVPILVWSLFFPVMPCPCITPEPESFHLAFVAYLSLHVMLRLVASKNRINTARYAISVTHAVFLAAVTAYRVELVGWAGIWVPAAAGLIIMEFWIIARLSSGLHKDGQKCGT